MLGSIILCYRIVVKNLKTRKYYIRPSCLAACPGLAIFGVDLSGDGKMAVVKLPYEFLPLPEPGEEVVALDREGNEVGGARVKRVQVARALDRTPIVSLEVPREAAMVVRHFKRKDSRP